MTAAPLAGLEPLEIDPAALAGLAVLETMDPTIWRTEITQRGKYWQWRERGRNGRSKYGGKTDFLPKERMEAHARRVERREAKKRA